jgi:hypothetical protein
METMFRADAFSGDPADYASIFGNLNTVGSDGAGVGMGFSPTAGAEGETAELVIWMQVSGYWSNIPGNTAGEQRMVFPGAIEYGKWYHAVACYDAYETTFYLNGEVLARVRSYEDMDPLQSSSMVIGGDIDGADGVETPMSGAISRLRIYSGGLSKPQVEKLASAEMASVNEDATEMPVGYHGISAISGKEKAVRGETLHYDFSIAAEDKKISILDLAIAYDDKLVYAGAAAVGGFQIVATEEGVSALGKKYVRFALSNNSGVNASELKKVLQLDLTAAESGNVTTEVLYIGAGGYGAKVGEADGMDINIALPEPAEIHTEVFHEYDFNTNGAVDYGDIAQLQKHYGVTNETSAWADIERLDIAGNDGRIDIEDLMTILVYVMGLNTL